MMVLICLSLIVSYVEHFPCAYWPFVGLLKNDYSGLLAQFVSDCLFFCLFLISRYINCLDIHKCFLPFTLLFFVLSWFLWLCKRLLSLVRSCLFIVAFVSFALGDPTAQPKP